ncbi:DUF3618 domain-containing protein [Azospirillum sp. RWY-5-1]|uniref:DUF3618 domain-containing protein n=1 Tax=Azospirillum oleiclasticum TaxID=2735135 RepID=A0ABX2TEX3_9PROT|nr:DUF3618 domain-containing protein [Azospirillum oleiclasticum]NYZ15123.1 DUF3618 domain-containing protein [Azospirillum oleiclasticum]NYZ22886.1 DUF3618 domain-containing protein [Azospirillum oleiclasticum]
MTAANDRTAPNANGSRTTADLEDDIRSIRARMDSTLDELEYRLSPGQLTGGVADLVRDVVQGKPNRTARAIRDNPIPVALIGIGVLWLAWAISRTPAIEGRRIPGDHPTLSDQRIRIILTGLVAATRQGSAAIHKADRSIADPELSGRLHEVDRQLARSAAALEEELHRHGGRLEPDAPPHPVWNDLNDALAGERHRRDLLVAVERGVQGTLDLFREALHEDLPAELRVVVGAHFHEMETVGHRVGALVDAAA